MYRGKVCSLGGCKGAETGLGGLVSAPRTPWTKLGPSEGITELKT